jgi:uncharacterized protein (TIGR03435 family)
LWDTPLPRIVFPPDFDRRRYDVTVDVPFADREMVVQSARATIESRFGLSIGGESSSRRVYVLTAGGRPSPQRKPARDGEQRMSGAGEHSIIGTGQSMRDIAQSLENLLGTPVLDESGVDGTYNYSVLSEAPPAEAAFDMARQLGVELTPAERQIEMLVVRRVAGPPQPER